MALELLATYHVHVAEDLHVDVLSDRGEEDRERLLQPLYVLLVEGRVPGLLVQERDEAMDHHVTVPAEQLLRVAAALNRLRARLGDHREVCAEHGFYDRWDAEVLRKARADDEGWLLCPRCEEQRLAADAAERLGAAKGA
jgi:hypothetical protein